MISGRYRGWCISGPGPCRVLPNSNTLCLNFYRNATIQQRALGWTRKAYDWHRHRHYSLCSILCSSLPRYEDQSRFNIPFNTCFKRFVAFVTGGPHSLTRVGQWAGQPEQRGSKIPSLIYYNDKKEVSCGCFEHLEPRGTRKPYATEIGGVADGNWCPYADESIRLYCVARRLLLPMQKTKLRRRSGDWHDTSSFYYIHRSYESKTTSRRIVSLLLAYV